MLFNPFHLLKVFIKGGVVFLFLNNTTVQSQILNVESLRKVTDTSGFSGAASFNFSVRKNVNQFLLLGNDIHLQYKMNKHLYLFKNDLVFQKIENQDFDNSLISHFRYNYKINNIVTWEAFLQGQTNRVNLINFRALAGTGPRFKLSKSEKYKFYLGAITMFEYEEVGDNITPIQRILRESFYFSTSLYPTKNITFVSTTYYQPSWSAWSDYRISTDNALVVSLIKNLGLKISYLLVFDALPAIGIPDTFYNFTTGVTYTFD